MVSLQAPGMSSLEGMELARELLCPLLDHEIHDYVLEGVCKALDGNHILAVAPTSGGKTSYYYGYILLLKALQQVDPPCPFLKRMYPANPVMVIVVMIGSACTCCYTFIFFFLFPFPSI